MTTFVIYCHWLSHVFWIFYKNTKAKGEDHG